MNNKHQELIAEKVAEFNKIFNTENVWQGEDDWTKNVPIGNLEQWLAQTLQDTIDTVLEEERKLFKDIVNVVDEEFLALPDAEDYIGEWTINMERKRILEALDKTPLNKV